jgi:hypothetical protein
MHKFLQRGGISLAVLTLVMLSILYLLPPLLENFLLPRLLRGLPVAEKTIRLDHLSPWSLRGGIRLDEAGQPALVAPRVVLRYSPATLLRGRVSSLTIEGADLHLEKDNNGIRIKGLKATGKEQGAKSSAFAPPFLPEEVVFRDCAIILHQEGTASRPIIVDARLELGGAENGDREPESSPARTQLEVRFQAASPDISAILDLLPATAGTRLSGGLTLKGGMHLQPDSLRIADAELTAAIPSFSLQTKGGEFAESGLETPLSLHILGQGEAWRFSLSGLQMLAPLQTAIAITGDFSLAADGFAGKAGLQTELSAAPVLLTAKSRRQGQEAGIDLQAQGRDLRIRQGGVSLDSGAYRLNGTFVNKAGGASGLLSGEFAGVDLPAYGIHLEKVGFSLPLSPTAPRQEPRLGNLEIPGITYRGKHLASIKAELKPAAKGLSVAATAKSPLAPDLRFLLSAALAENGSLHLTAEIPEGPFAVSSLDPLITLPPGLQLAGRLQGKASISFGPDQGPGTATLQLRQGRIEMPKEKIVLSGIDLKVAMPALPLLHSDPGQLLRIETIDLGNLHFSDASMHFRLQDLQTIFIEKARLAWCDGHVEAGSLTLAAGLDKLETVLYCDRLNFSQLLGQFGIHNSEGQGSLNGRLPISISGTDIRFDDGFLFSTPGEHGRVRFSNTEALRQGMSASDRAASLDYSLDALKNFSYNWARLHFNTTGNDLLIAMQIDGKPATPLPYAYRAGQIVKDAKGAGMQHPIQLDVNFHLPSMEIFRFGKNIQTIRENM